ncbi:poly [ADP-ribose] polymerase 15-like [Limulus polyphemus]|uniref:Poly [ADP-ribose] polymerase n=1 Tax=Limulus polyphemus TaxID=6850 RepID=A0ABM1BQX3_LIMPO|nr:poly [ADP-ribose] polymerase 15-like [Limulus polyphemus]
MKYIINLEGSTSNVVSGKAAILGEIVAYHESMPRESTFNVPPHWDTQQNKTTALIPLDSKSSEYSRVEQKFYSTIMGKKITTVFRIQNLWLWQKYCQHKELLEMKNIDSVDEKLLFHGTRSNEPKRIYDNEEGFDMRFSAKGMWGNANYFAENASYSDAYAYKNSSGAKEIFLALVLTGDSIRLSPDSNLRMPPPKSSNVIAEGKVQFAETRYDTVNGFTQDSTVYMTYDNLKAYPAYLITYM